MRYEELECRGALNGSIFANYLFSKLYDFEPVNFKAGLDLGSDGLR